MPRIAATLMIATLVGVLLAGPSHSAGKWNGTLKLGSVFLDEDAGDLSAVQETYDLEEGFSLSQIRMNGRFNDKNFLTFNLRDLTLDSRKGYLTYRMPNRIRATARYDQNRYVYDVDRAVTSERKNWMVGADGSVTRWLRLSADFSNQTREGERLAIPMGTESALGDGYDNSLNRGRAEVEVHKDGRGVALGYEFSDFSDNLFETADRTGQVASARAYGACYLLPEYLSHFARGSFGKSELSNSGLDYELATFQYIGIVRPHQRVQFKYTGDVGNIDNKSTELETFTYRHEGELAYLSEYGRVYGGFGYIGHDDELAITDTDIWRFGLTAHYEKLINARFSYASREKDTREDATLLKDLEDTRIRASVRSTPIDELTVGVSFVDREREFLDIDVASEGQTVTTFARAWYSDWGSVTADYTYSNEQYDNRLAPFEAESHIVTARVDFEYVKDLRVSGGTSYIDVGKDLDIEKSILFFEGMYTYDDYFVEAKYNVYNYDDFILLDRYYTANVVWVNIGYNFSVE